MTTHHKPKIKTGDTVKVIAGNHKNKTGKVLAVLPKKLRAIVEGINLLTHYQKPTQAQPKGGITQKEGTIHLSNLVLLDPTTKQPTRVARKKDDQGKTQRYAKKTGKPLSA